MIRSVSALFLERWDCPADGMHAKMPHGQKWWHGCACAMCARPHAQAATVARVRACSGEPSEGVIVVPRALALVCVTQQGCAAKGQSGCDPSERFACPEV